MSDVDLVVYSKGLEDLPVEDLGAVVKTLSMTPRGEFEPRIPELGDLRRMVQRVGWQRKREAREAEQRQREEDYRRKVLAEREEDERNGVVVVNADALVEKLAARLGVNPADYPQPSKPLPESAPEKPCRHCGLTAGSLDPEELRRMARFYERRAEAMDDRAAMLAEKLAQAAVEVANAGQPEADEVTA